jgi:hypothetical protein
MAFLLEVYLFMSSPDEIVDNNADTTTPRAPRALRITFVDSRDPRNVRPDDRLSSYSSSTDDEEPASTESLSTSPSESTSPTRQLSVRPRMSNVASPIVTATPTPQKRKTGDSVKPNGCPDPGTEAAFNRTLHASYSRCKTDEAKRLFRASKQLPEDWEPEPPKENRKKKYKPAAQDNTKRQRTASPQNRDQPVTEMPLPPINSAFSPETLGVWVDPVAEEQRWIQQYYEGLKTPHLFCVIARVANEYEKEDKSNRRDYHCFSAVLHPFLDGSQALGFTHNFLSAIRSNSGALRCELNQAVQSYHSKTDFTNCLLDSTLISCFPSVTPYKPTYVFNTETRMHMNSKGILNVEHC